MGWKNLNPFKYCVILGIYMLNYNKLYKFRGIIKKKHLINRTCFAFSIQINRTHVFQMCKKIHQSGHYQAHVEHWSLDGGWEA